MNNLPLEILEKILIESKIKISTLFQLKKLNKSFHKVISDMKEYSIIDNDDINKIIIQSNNLFFWILNNKNINISINNINTIIINKDLSFFNQCFNYNNFKKVLYKSNRFHLENPIDICDKYGYNDKKKIILNNNFNGINPFK